MSYVSGGTTIRADLSQALIEAPQADIGLIGAQLLPIQNVDAKAGTYLKVQLAAGELLSNNALKKLGMKTVWITRDTRQPACVDAKTTSVLKLPALATKLGIRM